MGEHSDLDDGALVRRACLGNEAAYGELVRRYRRAAYALALSVTGRREDAEDVAQEAFIVALERIDECRKPERFAAWLLAIVRNRSKNLLRRESLREAEPIPFSAASGRAGPDRIAERHELRQRLAEALAKLTEVQRQVVLLHDLEGWKHKEIGDRLDMPSGTVRSHLHYARKNLRALLSRESRPEAAERVI